MLNNRELKQLAAVLPRFRDVYNNMCAAYGRDDLETYAALSSELGVIIMAHTEIITALTSYSELDAALLDAQETNADLEETLEAANRDLESLIHHAPKVERGDYAALHIQ